MRPLNFALGVVVGSAFFIAASIVLAWTGPTSAPPNGNVAPPINVGTTDQVKNGGLAINALAVFGNAILAGASSYLNFGATSGSTGYGIRDNAGTMEFKNSAGSWQSLLSPSSTFSQIKFADGTTQTTALAAGGVSGQTTASCALSPGSGCSVSCPSGYVRSGCSGYGTLDGQSNPSRPSGSGCYCTAPSSLGSNGGTCYIYCVR